MYRPSSTQPEVISTGCSKVQLVEILLTGFVIRSAVINNNVSQSRTCHEKQAEDKADYQKSIPHSISPQNLHARRDL